MLLGLRAYGEFTKREMLSAIPQENSGLCVGGLC